jgi:hypothetical protein
MHNIFNLFLLYIYINIDSEKPFSKQNAKPQKSVLALHKK